MALLSISTLAHGRPPIGLDLHLQKILAKATATYPGPGGAALSLGVSLPEHTALSSGIPHRGVVSLSSGARQPKASEENRGCDVGLPVPGCVRPDDKFAMGSSAKMYTAAAVLRLVDQGKFSLDDKALPLFDALWTRMNGTSIVNGLGPQIKKVTVRDLLGMRSGIPDYDSLSTRQYQFDHPHEDIGPVKSINFLAPLKNYSCAPGTCGEYSSTNYELLGLILAQQAGKSSWDEYSQGDDLPFLPEMRSTWAGKFGVRGPCSKYTHVHAYSRQDPSVDVFNISCTNGWTCGNLISNAADAAIFARALLGQGERVLSTQTQQEMLKFVPLTSKAWGFGLPYGLGVMDLGAEFGMKAGVLFGHAGETYGFNALSAYSKEYDFGLAVVANNENGTLTYEVFQDAFYGVVNYLNHTQPPPPTLAPPTLIV